MDWVNEVLDLIGGREIVPLENIARAQELKRIHFPKSLFKYRRVNEFSLLNLRESSLFLAPATAFNDPYDSAFNFDPHFGRSYGELLLEHVKDIPEADKEGILAAENPILQLIRNKNAQYPPEHRISDEGVQRIVQAMLKSHTDFLDEIKADFNRLARGNYKICSLCSRLDSLPLWAHYSGDHTGFAMEYDFTELPESDLLSLSLWPVVYRGVFDGSEMLKGRTPGQPFNNLLPVHAALHKSPDWAYEHEWRLVLPASAEEPARSYKAPLKRVYVGTKMEDKDVELIKAAAAIAGVPVYRMKHMPAEFKVVPEENPL